MPATPIHLPVGAQDIVVRMSDHRTQWKKHSVDPTDILMVLVIDEQSSLPTWSPVRLCDCAVVIRPRPLVVKRECVEPTHIYLKDLYENAFRGLCECIASFREPPC